jgi:hypothetical protein
MRLVRTLLSSGILCGGLLLSGFALADVPSSGGGGASATTTSGTGGAAAGSGGSTAGSGGGSDGGSKDDSGCTVSKPGDSVAAGTMTALAVLALAIAGGSRRKNKKG